MATTIYLIRHGQTDWNVERRMQGHGGVGLNDLGRQQARQIAAHLNGQTYTALYSSDLDRALETAHIIGSAVNLKPIPEPLLRERDQGEWEGSLLSDLPHRYPEVRAQMLRDPANVAPPGGENFGQVAARMQAALDAIAGRHPGQHVIAVSHGLAIAIVRALLAGEPLQRALKLLPENAEITQIQWPVGDQP